MMHGQRAGGVLVAALLVLACSEHAQVTAHKPPPAAMIAVENIRVHMLDSVSAVAAPANVSNNEWVTVTVSGPAPAGSWIGAYAPPTTNPLVTAPIKWAWVPANGAGVQFQMVNMRGDYVFYVYHNGTGAPTQVAVSNVVTMWKAETPLKPRLLLTGVAGEMRLMWSSAPVTGAVAMIGTQSGVYTTSVTATSATYTSSDMCGSPATTVGYRDPGMIYSAVFTGLAADSTYYYVFGSPAAMSDEFVMLTPPAASPAAQVRLLAYGDMGQASPDDSFQYYQELPSLNTTNLLTQEVLSGAIDAVFHIGDISYARGYASEWDLFLNQITPIASRVPYMVCLGNHERDFPNSGGLFQVRDSGGECGVAMEAQFLTPRKSQSTPWYSVDIGPVHAVFMSTEHMFNESSPQLAFLEADLASVDRSVTPWIIFSGHRPMYIDSNWTTAVDSDQVVASLLRQWIEPLLYKYQVDLAMWGHHHSYQRTCAVYETKCAQRSQNRVYSGPFVGTVHVVIGMAGQALTPNLQKIQPEYTEFADVQEFGYSRIDVASPTTLSMEFVLDKDGAIRDSFTIQRS